MGTQKNCLNKHQKHVVKLMDSSEHPKHMVEMMGKKIFTIFLFLNKKICCGSLKEPSQWLAYKPLFYAQCLLRLGYPRVRQWDRRNIDRLIMSISWLPLKLRLKSSWQTSQYWKGPQSLNGPCCKKTWLCCMRTRKGQTSLCIHAVCQQIVLFVHG